MKYNQKINSVIMIHICMLTVLMVAVLALVLAASTPAAWAGRDTIEYDEAEIFFELNNTDEDLGIHALIDGEGWRYLRIRDPRDRQMLNVFVQGRLRRQGLTEIFFESAEPEFGDLDPADFFDRFPEGEYTITGRTLERDRLESVAEITHVMPAPPVIYVNGVRIFSDEDPPELLYDCDTPLMDVDGSDGVTISWVPVTMSHPDPEGGGAGVWPPVTITVHNYEVVVEVETADEFEGVFSVNLPPDKNEVTIPSEFIELDDDGNIKFEVLVREESYNQTAVESCFVLAPAP